MAQIIEVPYRTFDQECEGDMIALENIRRKAKLTVDNEFAKVYMCPECQALFCCIDSNMQGRAALMDHMIEVHGYPYEPYC